MINAAGMTAEQAQAYFASMGYDVELKEVSPETTTTSNYSYYELDEEKTAAAGGVPQFKKTATDIPVTTTAGATAYAIETITPNGSYGGDINVETEAPKTSRTLDDGGGGGSEKEPEKAEKLDRDDVVERYKETEDALDDVGRAAERANKQADRLYGAGRIAAMAKANA
jgi:hypothetical protein